MTALDIILDTVRRREALERQQEHLQAVDFKSSREESERQRVCKLARNTFSPELLRQLQPKYDHAYGNIRPTMRFNCNGIQFQLSWGEFHWAEPGRQDYLEGRHADGKAVQFSPDFPGNDEKLALLIDSYARQRSWVRWLIPSW
jgi:hypothetical protein